jgi:hypothetical protein
MKSPKKSLQPPSCEAGAFSILRSRAHHLGTIEAPDQRAAETEAAKLFGLTEDQRKRLLVLERE